MVPGTIIAMGGKDYVVPPLTLGQLRAVMPRVQQIAGLDPTKMGDAQLKTLVDIITAALQRNYPEITPEEVENLLDLGNAVPVLNAILGSVRFQPAELKPVTYEFGRGELIGQGHAALSGETNGAGEPAGPLPEGAAPLYQDPAMVPAEPATQAPASVLHDPMAPSWPGPGANS